MSKLNSYEVDAFGCHVWTGSIGDSNRRPLVWRGKTPVAAYLVIWRERHGDVPEGLVLDHMCRNQLCVNPDHLEPVTKSENEKRKQLRHRLKRAKCPHGHVLNEQTRLMTHALGVLCRVCAQEQR